MAVAASGEVCRSSPRSLDCPRLPSDLADLRRHAIAHSLFAPTSLKRALHRLGFVQADPIRSPARAEDLILRHRVTGYRAGDLSRRYPALDIEEDVLYAYGFLARPVWRLSRPERATRMTPLEEQVLATVRRFGVMHPRELEAHFGRERVINAWGGYSKATTRALEHLHRRGLLRVARREQGIRVYEAAPASDAASPPDGFAQLVLVVATILAPVNERTLLAIATYLRRRGHGPGEPRVLLRELLRDGALERKVVDGHAYVWPTAKLAAGEPGRHVRFLAPFDPVVWDRRRFEHLWGWPYRFEAYTPVRKRLRGYYAMPLLWGEQIIGWANAAVTAGKLEVELGFVGKRPRDRAFGVEADAEIARLETFLDRERDTR
jgi:uncharacterized protein YcaQ